MRYPALLCSLLVGLLCQPTMAQDFLLEEAPELSDDLVIQRPIQDTSYTTQHRAYIYMSTLQWPQSQPGMYTLPNIQGSLEASVTKGGFTVFGDGMENYVEYNKQNLLFINQLGVRYQLDDTKSIAVGKERNRRAPGIMLSPSDLIYTQATFSGQQEDRRGEWLIRASYRAPSSSHDVFWLPVDTMKSDGLPAAHSQTKGWVYRGFQQWGLLDFSASLGEIQGHFRTGFSVQTFIKDVWKVYGELGTLEDKTQDLVGISYEGITDISAKLEYFHNGITSAVVPIPLFSSNQLLLSAFSVRDIRDRINIFTTLGSTLDSGHMLSFGRVEYVFNSHLVSGASLLTMPSVEPFYGLDLKWSFE